MRKKWERYKPDNSLDKEAAADNHPAVDHKDFVRHHIEEMERLKNAI
jgi:hypothetical protein